MYVCMFVCICSLIIVLKSIVMQLKSHIQLENVAIFLGFFSFSSSLSLALILDVNDEKQFKNVCAWVYMHVCMCAYL